MKNSHADIPSWLRWTVLIIASLGMFGNYYLYDSIAPIADLLESELGFSDTNISRLYSFYSWASIAALIFGGVFIDKFGTRISILIFGTLCALAGVITMLDDSVVIMLIGRTILGLGAELLIVAITVSIAKWFKGKVLGFAMGINLFIARGGSWFADRSPDFFENLYSSWKPPLELAMIIGMLCLVSGVLYFLLEGYANRKYELAGAEETDKLSLKGLFSYSRSFWIIVLLCVTFYSAVFPFRSFAIKFFQHFHEIERGQAGALLSYLPMASMFATPFIGLLVDLVGKRSSFMLLGSFLLMPVFLIMVYSNVSLVVPIAMLGVAFSLIPAIMWPSVAYVVDVKRLGTAYALMTLIQQIGVGGMNEGIGFLNDLFGAGPGNAQGYIPMIWALSALGVLALIFSIWLRIVETGPRSHGLELPVNKINKVV
jgi:MFS family permease